MMSAEDFARQSAIWHRATPTLEQYTRWVNRNCLQVGWIVPLGSAPGRRSVVAEMAAGLAAGMSMSQAWEAAKASVSGLPRVEEIGRSLSTVEEQEAGALADNIAQFIDWWAQGKGTEWAPSFPGCGIVSKAMGDLAIESHLVEIKSVQRPFRGQDFRQALTYAALGYSVARDPERISLLNPRLGLSYTAEAADLALDIGAGSWVDLMQDLVAAMSDEGVSQ